MQCAYCLSEVHPDASRCPACRSEIAPFRPLLSELGELRAELASLQARVRALEGLPTPQAMPESLQTALPAAARVEEEMSLGAGGARPSPAWIQAKAGPLAAWAACTVASLGLMHYLLLFELDARPLVLRLVTLVWPMLLGAAALRRHSLGLRTRAAFSLITGAAAVALMLAITAALDAVPFWPQTGRDAQETLEYILGISLAHLGGGLAPGSWRRVRLRRRAQSPSAAAAAGAQMRPKVRTRLVAGAGRVRQVAAAVAPVASCGTALYSGLKSYMGW